MRLRSFFVVLGICLVGAAPLAGCAQEAPDPAAALRAGQYEDARAQLEARVQATDRTDEEVSAYFDTFRLTGAYEEGLREAEALLQNAPNDAFLHHAHGQLLVDVGRYEEAEAAFVKAGQANTDYHRNALDLADLYEATGRRGQAQRLYNAIYRRYRAGEFRTAKDLAAGGRAAAASEDFHEANAAFRTAHQLDPNNVAVLFEWAELFRAKYNEADAQRTYQDALALAPNHPDVLVGMAQSVGSFAQKEELAQRALATNPNHVGALSLMASLRILDDNFEAAEELLNRALAVNPVAIDALAHQATIYRLLGDEQAFVETSMQALNVNSLASSFYVTIAENLTLQFRYPDVVEVAQLAVRTDPGDPKAHGTLGTALLRLGDTQQARRHLELSFDDDPFNLFVGNTLTLLDEYENFSLLEGPNVQLLIHNDERDVLGPAMLEEAEAAYAALSERYPYTPPGKLFVEAYNDPSDFAVRIAGVPHLGLLGVSFGDVVALNTPRAQAGNPYNWARTLWHELAHTMAIGVSQNQVPRWFTEGLSVYEEQRARGDWGREMDLELFAAMDRDALLDLDNIDEGFTRPQFPGQVLLSYYHASKVIGFMVEQHGFESITGTLQELATGKTIAEALEAATGETIFAIDDAFRADLQQQRAALMGVLEAMPDLLEEEVPLIAREAGQNPFLQKLNEGADALANENYDTAETRYREALAMYPNYAGAGNAYVGLAAIYRARDEQQKLIDILRQYLDIAEHAADEARELGMLYAETGQPQDAITYLRRSLEIDPYDLPTHEQLADLNDQLQRHDRAIPYRRAVLALNPVDQARAHYALAQSLHGNGETVTAKRAVLQALEQAPGFRDAQRLLLTIVEGSGNREAGSGDL